MQAVAADKLTLSEFMPIHFDKIKPTAYRETADGIEMKVNDSSSFLFKPYKLIASVKQVVFEWKTIGALSVATAEQQKSKAGDDARLRVGLILSGPEPAIPMMAPQWLKTIRELLKFPADKMRFVLAGTPVPVGAAWKSPYSDDITCYAAEDKPLAGGWRRGRAKFPGALKVVGLWIMADGDDTHAQFTTWLRKLELNP